jgi:hypothetical protein
MRPVVCLLTLLILLPHLAAADPLTALALGQLLPVFAVLALLSCGLLGFGARLVLRDLRSDRENPRRLTLALLAANVLFGMFLTPFSDALASKTGPSFPNLFTEVFMPLAVTAFARKKMRLATSAAGPFWLGLSSAGLLVLANGAAGLFTFDYAAQRGGTDPMLVYFLFSLVVWVVVARKFCPQLPAAAKVRRGAVLGAPAIGAVLAALYATALYLTHAWLVHQPYSSSYLYIPGFLQEQLLRVGLGTAFGILVLLVMPQPKHIPADEAAEIP